MPQKFWNDDLQDAPDGSPSVETRDFHPRDKTLRSVGFSIHARPNSGHDLWERGGKLYTVKEAIVIADEETRIRLQKAEKARKKAKS